ncbi:hypothetical protein AZ022_002537, partial [Klebsiella pneumoniae]
MMGEKRYVSVRRAGKWQAFRLINATATIFYTY